VLPELDAPPLLEELLLLEGLPLLELLPEVFPAPLAAFLLDLPTLPQAAMPSIMRTERTKESERFNHPLLDYSKVPGSLGLAVWADFAFRSYFEGSSALAISGKTRHLLKD